MLALCDALAALAPLDRAQSWQIRLHSGWSTQAPVREYHVRAPPTAEAARLVLMRLHNALLLLAPAAAELHAPVDAFRLEPTLSNIQAIHHVPIVLDRRPVVHAGLAMDVPSADLAPLRPAGAGLAAGLDLGGTGMKACVVKDGVLLRTCSAPTWPDGESGVESLIRRARALLVEAAAGEPLGSLGVGLAAPMGTGGQVTELSTILRERVGNTAAFDGFGDRIAKGLVEGPVTVFNDLANLGRYLSHVGNRKFVRLQIGTSFGGCWIDANGDVFAVEMGRLVVDVAEDARPHPYLPLAGAMRSYLSNAGVATFLAPRVGHPVDARTSGHLLRGLLDAGDPAADALIRSLGDLLVGVCGELVALLPGIQRVEVGGSMLLGPAGRRLEKNLAGRGPFPITISPKPGFDGALAAALAPRVVAILRGHRRVSGER